MRTFFANGVLVAASALVAALLMLGLVDAVIMPHIVDVPNVKVPRLHSLSASQASQRLQQWGLKIATGDSIYHERIPLGSVIDHLPEAGQRVKKGRAVTVLLSKGPRYYTTPSLQGVSLREARLQLESNQLQTGNILYVSSNEIPETAVIDQHPTAGTPLKRDSRVDLRISNGPPSAMKTTPNLIALPIDSAEDTLRKYEMQLGRIESQIDNSSPPGTIISQAPKPGTQTPRNTRIHLRVSAQHPQNGAR